MGVIVLLLALLIGIALGLIGGGGSILTVPVLVYVAGISPTLATAYSLFIVGTTSLVGAMNNMRKQLVHVPTAIVFSIPSFIAVYCVRKYAVPLIPDPVFMLGQFVVTKNIFIMVFFAVIMLIAAISMLYDGQNKENTCLPDRRAEFTSPIGMGVQPIQFNYPLIILEGLVIGALTGFVGAGGGFLIIPALVMMAKLPMRLAIGTSLLIIATKSLIGFIGDVQNLSHQIDWLLLLSFSSMATVGIFLGGYFGRFVKASNLKKGFGWFVIVMAVYILTKELLHLNIK